jgi:hypothetical protein
MPTINIKLSLPVSSNNHDLLLIMAEYDGMSPGAELDSILNDYFSVSHIKKLIGHMHKEIVTRRLIQSQKEILGAYKKTGLKGGCKSVKGQKRLS